MAGAQDAQPQVEAWLSTFAAANTRAAYRRDLAVFLAWCQERGLSAAEATQADAALVERFQEQLTASGSEATARRRSSAVHGFLQWCAPSSGEAGGGCGSAAGGNDSTTIALSSDHLDEVLRVLAPQVTKAQVLVTLLVLDGLKLDEVLALDVGDIGDVGGRPPRFDVEVTRGPHTQRLSLHPTTSQAMGVHLSERTDGGGDGPLLLGRGGLGSRLTRFGADYLVKQVGRAAGLGTPLTSNVLRRTYVGHAHARGDTLDDIRHRVGHNDVRTTRRYLPDGDHGR